MIEAPGALSEREWLIVVGAPTRRRRQSLHGIDGSVFLSALFVCQTLPVTAHAVATGLMVAGV
jgi:hypothetical protein